jgi:hypothetical protein
MEIILYVFAMLFIVLGITRTPNNIKTPFSFRKKYHVENLNIYVKLRKAKYFITSTTLLIISTLSELNLITLTSTEFTLLIIIPYMLIVQTIEYISLKKYCTLE